MNARGIEQERRRFKRLNPDLYKYIVDHEVAKVWDSAGDSVGASNPWLSNHFWHLSGVHAASARAARESSQQAP